MSLNLSSIANQSEALVTTWTCDWNLKNVVVAAVVGGMRRGKGSLVGLNLYCRT